MLDLSQISKTLLLPLIGRATNNLLNDSEARQIMGIYKSQLEPYFKFCKEKYSDIWAARALFFDTEIRQTLTKNPQASIINLGAGLDTTFYRVNNGQINWIDLDLPEVINIRQELLTRNPQVTNITCSILDFTWLDKVVSLDIVIAGGVLFYFTTAEVEEILTKITNKFPNAIILFDTISSRQKQKTIKRLKKMNLSVSIGWAIDRENEVKFVSNRPYIIKKYSYFHQLKHHTKLPLLQKLRMIYSDLFNKSGFFKVYPGKIYE